MMNFFVPVLCMITLMCLRISQANDCKVKPTRCPLKHEQCYCFPSGRPVEIFCKDGAWAPKPCDKNKIPTTILTTLPPTTPEITCRRMEKIPFAIVKYLSPNTTLDGYPLGAKLFYRCEGTYPSIWRYKKCKDNGWVPKEKPICSCSNPPEGPNEYIVFKPDKGKTQGEKYRFGTTATYYCRNTKSVRRKATCTQSGWTFTSDQGSCLIIPKTEKTKLSHPNKKTTAAPSAHHSEERTVVIVSGTTGAILGALIILVVIVSCQRRLHYHRVRRARLRHRQDQEAFAAFITYHRDVRLMLPSYDEAINQQEHGQPPSFEEALAHEEPSHPPAQTPERDSPPSISTDSTSTSNSPGSETRNSPETRSLTENDSETAHLIDRQSSVSPASEDSRFFRSLRALFGGRAFRPDAIYCRFVPEEDRSESPERGETSESRNNSTDGGEERERPNDARGDDELTDVLAQAGLF